MRHRDRFPVTVEDDRLTSEGGILFGKKRFIFSADVIPIKGIHPQWLTFFSGQPAARTSTVVQTISSGRSEKMIGPYEITLILLFMLYLNK